MLKLREENGRVFVCGRTYTLRGELKRAGLKWDRTRQMWWGRDRRTAETLVNDLNRRHRPEYRPIRTNARYFHRMKADLDRLTDAEWAQIEAAGLPRLDERGAVFRQPERTLLAVWDAAEALLQARGVGQGGDG